MMQYVKTKLPLSLRSNTDDIMAEIWTAIGYLSQKFDEDKGISFISYCNKYAAKIAINSLLKQYDDSKRYISLDSMTKKEIETMVDTRTPVTEAIDKDEKIEISSRIADVLKSMGGADLQMAKMYLTGFSLEKIGEYFGISRQAVVKRLKKYAKEDEQPEEMELAKILTQMKIDFSKTDISKV